MADGRFISYLRVSTDAQGRSGLGLEAQRAAVESYLNGGKWKLLAEYVEVESGTHNDRPQLAAALKACRLKKCALIIAKLDRLARNARFLLSVVEGTGEHGVVFCDLPSLPPGPVGKFMVTQMAAVAELEAGLISARTKAALAAAKARGTVLGGYRGGPVVDHHLGSAALHAGAMERAEGLRDTIVEMRSRGLSLRAMAAELTERGIATPRGGKWTQSNLALVVQRLAQKPTE